MRWNVVRGSDADPQDRDGESGDQSEQDVTEGDDADGDSGDVLSRFGNGPESGESWDEPSCGYNNHPECEDLQTGSTRGVRIGEIQRCSRSNDAAAGYPDDDDDRPQRSAEPRIFVCEVGSEVGDAEICKISDSGESTPHEEDRCGPGHEESALGVVHGAVNGVERGFGGEVVLVSHGFSPRGWAMRYVALYCKIVCITNFNSGFRFGARLWERIVCRG